MNPVWPATALAALLAIPLIPFDRGSVSAQPSGDACSTTELGNATFGTHSEVDADLNSVIDEAPRLLGDQEARKNEAAPQSAIRFKVKFRFEEGADWVLEFRDPGLRLLDRIAAKDVQNGASIWTTRFNATQASAHLIGASSTDAIKIVEAIVYRSEDAMELFSVSGAEPQWESLHGDPDGRGVEDLRLARMGDSVGMMVASGVNRLDQTESWCCSGVMLSPTIYLTNWHCGGNKGFSRNWFWNPDVNATVLIDLAWDSGARNRQYRSEKVLYTNQAMDFALLRVAPTRGGTGDDIGAVGVAIGKDPAPGANSIVIHHPQCKPKMATRTACKIDKVGVPSWKMADGSALPDADFYHSCDTDTGSSGAPVFNNSGELIGLHHLGFAQPQTCEANPPRKNRAVRIEAILEDIKAKAPDLYAEIAPGSE